ncbi:MAG TPA: hypothetical protein VH370_20715 [Humisphaera sp.]|nr:hypothetical protein [Humisphaera sp.]
MRQPRPPHTNTAHTSAAGSARPTKKLARRAGTARHLRSCATISLLGIVLAGCTEKGYRTEVVGNGQGGVDVKTVPLEPRAPTGQSSASTSTTRPTSSEDELRAKIDAMQAQIDRQNQEIQRLKQLGTGPTTQP